MPLLRKVDAVVVSVPSLEAGLAFYADRLGHPLLWRDEVTGQAGLGLPESDTELVLSTRLPSETDWLVADVDEAVAGFRAAGGTVTHPPRPIPVGRVAVVQDPFANSVILVDLSAGRYGPEAGGRVAAAAMNSALDRDAVLGWVAGYERAWRDNDAAAVGKLFTEDARYRPSPYEADEVGHDAIRALWPDQDAATFRMRAEPVAIDGRRAVVRVEVDYLTPRRQQYRDLWVLTFGVDGRVADFEEWAYWPGQAYTATSAE